MYRSMLFVALLALIAAGAIWPAAGSALADPGDIDPRLAGYPELTIRLTESRIEAPASVSAGPTLLIEENTMPESGHAFILRVPDDVSAEELTSTLAGGSAAEETPEWFWRAEFLGNGDRATSDRPARALVELKPGRYIAGDPFRPATEYALFDVVGAADASNVFDAPEADVELDLFEMGFNLPAIVPSGPRVWEARNTGAMLHEIAIFPVPAGATPDEVEQAMAAELGTEFGGDAAEARAAIDALGPLWKGWNADLAAGIGVLSPQRVSWAEFALRPGAYGAVCFVPEQATGTPHLMLGMTAVFTVAAQDT